MNKKSSTEKSALKTSPDHSNSINSFIVLWLIGPACSSLLAWLFTIGAVFGLVLSVQNVINIQELDQKGVVGPATIIDLSHSTENGRPYRTDYWLTFSFKPANQAVTYQKHISIPESDYKRLKVGELLPVKYVPSNPADSRLQGLSTDAGWGNNIYFAIGIVIIVLLVPALLWFLVFMFHKEYKKMQTKTGYQM